MNREFLEANPGDSALAARIRSYELAARMQTSIPEVIGFDGEPRAIRTLYGLDRPETAGFGRNCLLARRLLERGVRFVQLYPRRRLRLAADQLGRPRGHRREPHQAGREPRSAGRGLAQGSEAARHARRHARGLDDRVRPHAVHRRDRRQGPRPSSARLHLLDGRRGPEAGLLPTAPSDEVGYQVAEDPVTIYDFHATILHLLGIDHKRLTFYHNGIQRRLTDVHGEVITKILA